jgi:hypothetical protein
MKKNNILLIIFCSLAVLSLLCNTFAFAKNSTKKASSTQTGKQIKKIPAKKVSKFKAGSKLADGVKK